MKLHVDAKQYVLSEVFLEGVNTEDPQVMEFLNSAALLFIMRSLDDYKRLRFLELLDLGDADVALDYAKGEITDFDENLQDFLAKKVRKVISQ